MPWCYFISISSEKKILIFVENQKKKIAFATSFGHDEYNEKETDIIKRKYLLKRFSHIALREKTANLCENIFAITAK